MEKSGSDSRAAVLSPLILLIALACALPAPAAAVSCESLASLSLPAAKITRARIVPAGEFSRPNGTRADIFKTLPRFCGVEATLSPSNDSDIRVEVWLPVSGWNRKLQVVGNSGWAGSLNYTLMSGALAAGYATASTDTGHATPGGSFALGHPEKLIDFSWRSEHEMTVKAKAVVRAFYGQPPRRSYWNGCSTGGRQALQEARMFPEDFDGIIAGAPGNRTAMAMWIAHALLKDPAAYIPREKYPLIHKAALDACDAIDGLRDGLIDDPTRCRFDPSVLLCKGAAGPDCITAPQVEAARKVYGPGMNPRTGQELFATLAPGSELGWATMGGGPEPYAPIHDQLRYVVFKDPAWDWRTFDFDKDNARFELPENSIMNAGPDVGKFVARGGKLLIYHGWNDPYVSPYMTIRYFQRVQDLVGARTADSVRLFMAPGMAHCHGGEGCSVFDKVGALDRWVEEGKAPDSIVASHLAGGKADRTRPLCPYPKVAKYKGTGSIDDAANFACAMP